MALLATYPMIALVLGLSFALFIIAAMIYSIAKS